MKPLSLNQDKNIQCITCRCDMTSWTKVDTYKNACKIAKTFCVIFMEIC